MLVYRKIRIFFLCSKVFFIICFISQLHSVEPVLVLFGPPGAGKGTFSQFAKENYGYTHLSVGDLVREEIDKQTELGKEADACLKTGSFLQESTIQALVIKHVVPLINDNNPFILDGFPRTEEAVFFIQDLFKQHDLNAQVLLILFNAKDSTCEERVLSRATCKQCGYVYNIQFRPPKKENLCDFCASPLKMRPHDTPEIVRKRLEEYHQITEKSYALSKHYFASIEFDTDQPLDHCLENYILFFDET